MRSELRDQILTLLDEHRIMTLATLRPDGWPVPTMFTAPREPLRAPANISDINSRAFHDVGGA
jgi:hypothetical protein